MLCNRCGHANTAHDDGDGKCLLLSCSCPTFKPPGDSDAYEGIGQVTDKSKSIQKRLAAQRGESIEQLVMSTADRLVGETWYNVATKLHEQLAVANEVIAAADAFISSLDPGALELGALGLLEKWKAAVEEFNRAKGG